MIVSCGEALIDLVPQPVPGGGPMNVAVAAAKLGAPAAFLGGVSSDPYGEQIWQHLIEAGVDVRIIERFDAPTATARVEMTPKVTYFFEGENTADTCLTSVDLSNLGPGPHIIHGGTLGMFRGDTAETLAALVEEHDGLISLDANIRPQLIEDRDHWETFHHRWLEQTDLYKVSDEDMAWIWPGKTQSSVVEELHGLGVGAVIVTAGEDGATMYSPNTMVAVPSCPVDVVDTVGAGDTFVASVLVSLWSRNISRRKGLESLDSGDWATILGEAAGASAFVCGQVGANPPSQAQLKDWMSRPSR